MQIGENKAENGQIITSFRDEKTFFGSMSPLAEECPVV